MLQVVLPQNVQVIYQSSMYTMYIPKVITSNGDFLN